MPVTAQGGEAGILERWAIFEIGMKLDMSFKTKQTMQNGAVKFWNFENFDNFEIFENFEEYLENFGSRVLVLSPALWDYRVSL